MRNKTFKRERCEKCEVKIPKHQPILVCDMCSKIKHLSCEKLSKSDASTIKDLGLSWSCHECLSNTLPVNAVRRQTTTETDKKKFKVKCSSCNGFSYSQRTVKTCQWCDGQVHGKCWKGELGCKSCCEIMIPGYHAYTHELYGLDGRKNNSIYNPYSSAHFAMQIGNALDDEENNNNVWSEISELLTNCKYKQLKDVKTNVDSELNIFSLNVQHLHNKIDKLRLDISDYQQFDLLCFNECNLKLETLPHGIADILLDGFHEPVFQPPIRTSGKGGGLTIYVNRRICEESDIDKTFNPNPEPENLSGEFQFIKIKNFKGSNKTAVVGNVYRSPSRNPEKFNNLLENVLQKLQRHVKKKFLYLVGDFNQDLIKHDCDTNSQNLIDITSSHGLVQLVSRPTRITDSSATLIDHVYTNNVDNVISCNILTLDLSDHLAIHTKLSLNSNCNRLIIDKQTANKKKEFRIFNEASSCQFESLINSETWEEINDDMDAQAQYDKFNEIYTRNYNTAYPLKTEKVRRKNERKNSKPWILPWLEDACARKKNLYHEFILVPTVENKAKYDKMNEFCAKHVDLAKSKYRKKYFEEHKDNSRKQWQMINELLNRQKKNVRVSRLIDDKGKIVNTAPEIAENFNDYFANIASNLKSDVSKQSEETQSENSYQNFLHQPAENELHLSRVGAQEVHKIIKNFKNKSTLDTKISALKIANKSFSFTHILAKIINKSFSDGIFPHQLKNARVVPIFKEGSKTEVGNYRPISLLSSFSKIYEKLMHVRILNFLDSNGVLHDMQYGFRPGRSCEHALLKAQQILLDSLSKRQVSLLLFIDFSKAFDMVEHSILLKKLEHYGIRGKALQWMRSYLENRMQFVSIDGTDSKTRHTKYGVPQGSILGPLLFIIYINDIPQVSNLAKFILYADDANIIITGNSIAEVDVQLRDLCKSLLKWVHSNGLCLNLKKTNYMIFSRSRKIELPTPLFLSNLLIEQKSEARFLGVIVDQNLTWSRHVKTVRSKMARYLGLMYKLKGQLPVRVRIQIYHSFVQSHINFCSLVWGFSAKSNIESLFTAQKKGMRAIVPGFINYRFRLDGTLPGHTKAYFSKYDILTVHSVIVLNALIFIHKIKHFPLALPRSIRLTVAENAPQPGDTHDTCFEWLQNFTNHFYLRSVFYKGPLLSIIPHISELNTPPALLNPKIYKSNVTKALKTIQSQGNEEEWQVNNFLLFNIPGLRKSLKNSSAVFHNSN